MLFLSFQGFNRLVAIALLFMAEEDAFWCLVYVIESLMPPEYYSRDKQLIGAQVDQVSRYSFGLKDADNHEIFVWALFRPFTIIAEIFAKVESFRDRLSLIVWIILRFTVRSP